MPRDRVRDMVKVGFRFRVRVGVRVRPCCYRVRDMVIGLELGLGLRLDLVLDCL